MKHADLLKPYAIHVAGIHSAISALSDDELTKLLAASESATQTNCWWATYQAAKLIGPEIRREIEARRASAEATLAKTKRKAIAPGCGDGVG